jgi:hypothetical protein
MSEETGAALPEAAKKKSWPRRIAIFVIGFVISLAIGWAIERVTDPEFLEGAKQAQADWIAAVSETSPITVATTYWSELQGAFTGEAKGGSWAGTAGKGQGLASPIIALVVTGLRFFYQGGTATLVLLGLGALAIAVMNLKARGSIFFDEFATNLLWGPIAVILTASGLGLILQGVMLGALYALSWITGLAAAAAGATGVAGFCWFCVTKLTEKSVEHIATPKVH